MMNALARAGFLYAPPVAAATGLLLDGFPTAIVGAYSFRKLRTAYSGAAVRVRRSSDNAEQDIGFTNNLLNTSALTGFCGSSSGYVTKLYNQNGSGQDIFNTVASTQPMLVNAGTVQTINGVPVMVSSSGGSTTYTIPAAIFGGLASSTLVVGFSQREGSQGWGRATSDGSASHTPFGDGNAYEGYLATTRPSFGPYGSTPGGATIHAASNSGSTLSVFKNGTQVGSAQSITFTNTPTNTDGADASYGGSSVAEMIFTGASLSNANRLILERSTGAYFGVTTA